MSMEIERERLSLAGRFRKQALFLSASALCFGLPHSAGAQPLDNTLFFSVYGGYLFNESDDTVDFTSDDDPLGVPADTVFNLLGQMSPGRDGGLFGVEAGGPLSPAWDWRIGLNGALFEDDRASSDDGFDVNNATNAFHYEYLDLALGYRPGFVPGGGLRLFGGPRVLHAVTELDYAATAGNKVGTYDRDVDLWAIGARAGAEAAIPVGASRASVWLSGAGSALYASSDVDYSFDFAGAPPAATAAGSDSESDSRGVYNFDAHAALNFAASDRVDLQLGYQVQQWWDLTTTFGAVESGDTTISDTGTGDVLVHGPFARMTIKLGRQP